MSISCVASIVPSAIVDCEFDSRETRLAGSRWAGLSLSPKSPCAVRHPSMSIPPQPRRQNDGLNSVSSRFHMKPAIAVQLVQGL